MIAICVTFSFTTPRRASRSSWRQKQPVEIMKKEQRNEYDCYVCLEASLHPAVHRMVISSSSSSHSRWWKKEQRN